MTCLLIDDDLDDQEVFALALTSIDPAIECMIASDGDEGLQKLKRLQGDIHDFIFIDYNMPRLSGLQTLTEIKKLFPGTNAIFILYSTTIHPSVIEKAMSIGAHHFLVKPSTLGNLVNELKVIFKRFAKAE